LLARRGKLPLPEQELRRQVAPPPKAFGGGLARRTYLWMVCSCSDGLLPLLGK